MLPILILKFVLLLICSSKKDVNLPLFINKDETNMMVIIEKKRDKNIMIVLTAIFRM